MTDLDDIDALAGEYVLGTLDRDERIAVAVRRDKEPALDKAIRDWERRLGPLSEVIAPVAPPPNLYSKIRAQIGLSNHVVSLKAREKELKARAARWRRATIGITALAACLAGVIGWREIEHRALMSQQIAALEAAKAEQQKLIVAHAAEIETIKDEQSKMATKYVAVLQSSQDPPAFLLTYDTKAQMCVISAIAAPEQKGKSYEVWMVHDKMPKPKSLGVYAEGDMKPMPVDPDADGGMFMNATYAVSLEPEGGSKEDGPTGPIVFSGKLVQATP